MNTYLVMILAIVAGSALSLAGGATIFATKKLRQKAILLTLPFGAGAMLAAAFLDLLPESFEMGDPKSLLVWTLLGFVLFFLLERSAGWFHRHHEHADHNPISKRSHGRGEQQNKMVMLGDLLHNAIDGVAIAAAFSVSVPTGVITTLVVSAHEIPKELGTFGILLSRGWKDKKVLMANVLTAVGTIVAASMVFWLGSSFKLPEAELLAMTSGFFIYIAASDVIPEIHEQPHRPGIIQAGVLVLGIVLVGIVIRLLGV